MEAALLKHRVPVQASGCSKKSDKGASLPSAGVVEESPDELDTLDGRLDESLAAFDEMLLKEMEDISEQSEQKMRQLAEQAAAAEERLKEQGIDPSGSYGEDGSEETGEEASSDGEGTDANRTKEKWNRVEATPMSRSPINGTANPDQTTAQPGANVLNSLPRVTRMTIL